MSLSFFKEFLKKILCIFSFIYSLGSLFFLILKINFKNKVIFLQPEGGFAHTILTPEVLKRIYKNLDWCVVFGYDIKRHNFLTKKLYTEHFYWLELSIPLKRISLIDEKYKNLIFKILAYYLDLKKIKFLYYTDFISKYNNLHLKEINPKFNKEGMLMHEYNAYKIFTENKIVTKEIFSENFNNFYLNKNIRKKCGIGFKAKNFKHNFSNERSSDDLNNYKKSFLWLVQQGWEIYLYGDKIEDIPKWFSEIESNIFYQKKSDLTHDEFNLKCGLICDCFIGPSSGASSWKYIFHSKPQLIIDSYPIGWGYFNSVVSFKFISKHNNLSNLSEIINDKIYLLNNPPFLARYSNEYEKSLIIQNFIKNIENLDNETLRPDDLNLDYDHPLIWSKTLISKTWYDLQKKMLLL